jgi:hypothetical protein
VNWNPKTIPRDGPSEMKGFQGWFEVGGGKEGKRAGR